VDYVDLAAHVTAMVTTIVGLIYATWPRQRAFPLWSALLKVTLLALFVWVLALGIDFALRSVMAPPRPTAEHGDVEGQQAADDDEDPPAREPVFGRIRGSPRNGPWPIMRLHPSGGVDHP
jgi:hypothetical protein